MTRVAIVVLNWNGFEDTKECLDSLLAQTYKNFSIVVVENGSKDDSAKKIQMLEQALSDDKIHILYNEENLGFAGGVNTGIQHALALNYDAVALFNNDATADPAWLSSLVREMDNKEEAGIVTGLLLHEDGKTIDSTGDYYSIWGMPFPRSRNRPTKSAEKSGHVFSGSGGASLYRASLFKDIGLFDERFFAYYEDVDVSFRAQLAGHKVYYTDKAVAYHKQGASSSKIPGFTAYQTFKNIPLLFIKNVPGRLFLSVGLRLFTLYILIFGNAVKNGNGMPALKGWLMSIWYFWTASVWQRFRIQSRKRVPTSYISGLIYHDIPPDQTGLRSLRKKITGK